MEIPIIFIHYGNSPYLWTTLYQLRQSNPEVKAYLIGTQETAHFSPIIQHIEVEKYEKSKKQLADVYRHFSTNGYEFEFICILRWFILRDFMQENNIQQCFYMDSDVLLYSSISEIKEMVRDSDMTISGISGHTNFIRLSTLQNFCNYVLARYQAPNAENYFKNYYENLIAQQGAGGVSDMTFLTEFIQDNPKVKAINLAYPINDTVFDVTIDSNFGDFTMENGIKKIVFQQQKPYGTLKNHDKLIQFHTLHFQGGQSKKIMLHFVPNKNITFWIGYYKSLLIWYFQRIRRKFLGI